MLLGIASYIRNITLLGSTTKQPLLLRAVVQLLSRPSLENLSNKKGAPPLNPEPPKPVLI